MGTTATRPLRILGTENYPSILSMTHYRRHIAFQPRPMAHKPPGCPDISFPLRCRATLDGLGLPSPSAFPQLAPMLAQLFECGRIDASSVTESGDPNTARVVNVGLVYRHHRQAPSSGSGALRMLGGVASTSAKSSSNT